MSHHAVLCCEANYQTIEETHFETRQIFHAKNSRKFHLEQKYSVNSRKMNPTLSGPPKNKRTAKKLETYQSGTLRINIVHFHISNRWKSAAANIQQFLFKNGPTTETPVGRWTFLITRRLSQWGWDEVGRKESLEGVLICIFMQMRGAVLGGEGNWGRKSCTGPMLA